MNFLLICFVFLFVKDRILEVFDMFYWNWNDSNYGSNYILVYIYYILVILVLLEDNFLNIKLSWVYEVLILVYKFIIIEMENVFILWFGNLFILRFIYVRYILLVKIW